MFFFPHTAQWSCFAVYPEFKAWWISDLMIWSLPIRLVIQCGNLHKSLHTWGIMYVSSTSVVPLSLLEWSTTCPVFLLASVNALGTEWCIMFSLFFPICHKSITTLRKSFQYFCQRPSWSLSEKKNMLHFPNVQRLFRLPVFSVVQKLSRVFIFTLVLQTVTDL